MTVHLSFLCLLNDTFVMSMRMTKENFLSTIQITKKWQKFIKFLKIRVLQD